MFKLWPAFLELWPAFYAILVVFMCYRYGKWRRDRGFPVTAREGVWIFLLTAPISFLALVLPSIFASAAMTPTDRLVAALLSVAIGALPLAVGCCISGALRLVRLYIIRARSAAEAIRGDAGRTSFMSRSCNGPAGR